MISYAEQSEAMGLGWESECARQGVLYLLGSWAPLSEAECRRNGRRRTLAAAVVYGRNALRDHLHTVREGLAAPCDPRWTPLPVEESR